MIIKKKPYDGVITAVRYSPDGSIEWVRAFERHGYVFTDRMNLDRASLLERLEDGKRFKTGARILYAANDFDIQEDVRLAEKAGTAVILAGNVESDTDSLGELPTI